MIFLLCLKLKLGKDIREKELLHTIYFLFFGDLIVIFYVFGK